MPSSGQPPEIMMVSDDNSDTRSILAWVTCLATWVMVKSGPSLLLRAMSGSAVAVCDESLASFAMGGLKNHVWKREDSTESNPHFTGPRIDDPALSSTAAGERA